jgi:arsenical pump membrane protein
MPTLVPQAISSPIIWTLCILCFLLILWRPRGIAEYWWASGGAVLLVALGLVPLQQAGASIRAGASVYLFLTGMMLLADLARQHGLFDWLAAQALRLSRDSQPRLFTLIYGIGIAVTALMSNDATAVLLTPAVLAVVRRTRTSPLPYLFTCAFIANAASFVLPISNPANLVVFDGHLPPLGTWLRIFLLPAAGAIVITFLLLRWRFRTQLAVPIIDGAPPKPLTQYGRRAGIGILAAATGLLATSAMGGPIGPATLVAGLGVLLFVARSNWRLMRAAAADVSWGVLPLVAALFVLVGALQRAGALQLCLQGLAASAAWPRFLHLASISFSIGIAANAINNLPMGLIAASALGAAHASAEAHSAVLVGINLGPNLSVTGSLATILWLIALRRERIQIGALHFLREGILLMPAALLAAVGLLTLTVR